MSEKIKSVHLQRAAYVYVRQSTAYQVRHHREGQQRQYDLQRRAEQLGFCQIVLIDEDLGRSGSGMQERPGFGRLLAAVCQGLAGAVLALEASRLARNNLDWHRLIDLCALSGTLLIDDEGIYDPKLLNDRLISRASAEASGVGSPTARAGSRGWLRGGLVAGSLGP
jgi:DNA invertase Pin-like site-specific DNA recombinase